MTNAYRSRAVVAEDGSITINDLPVPSGVEVEVLILVDVAFGQQDDPRYPLRGLPVELD